MEELICEDCGCKGKDVEEGICPYAREIHGVDVDVVLCPSCYEQRAMDI